MNGAKIEDVLLAMGVPAGIKGFTYITDEVEVFGERGINIRMTKELYPMVAEKNDTTSSRVERAIGNAFEVVRGYKGNKEVFKKYIGFKNCENSNSLKQLYMMLKREETE